MAYADKFNARYSFSESDYVDVPTRFQEFVDENRLIEIKMACREFKRRNPQFKSFKDIPLCSAKEAKGNQGQRPENGGQGDPVRSQYG